MENDEASSMEDGSEQIRNKRNSMQRATLFRLLRRDTSHLTFYS